MRTPKSVGWAARPKLVKVINELMNHGNVTWAIRKAKAGRGWVYRWRQEDADFAAAFEEAKKCGLEVLKDEAHARAYAGWDEPVFYEGEEVAQIRKKSDSLLMFLIKQSDPSYREHFRVDHGNAAGRPLMLQVALHPDALAAHSG